MLRFGFVLLWQIAALGFRFRVLKHDEDFKNIDSFDSYRQAEVPARD
jgi:hypothetical protein